RRRGRYHPRLPYDSRGTTADYARGATPPAQAGPGAGVVLGFRWVSAGVQAVFRPTVQAVSLRARPCSLTARLVTLMEPQPAKGSPYDDQDAAYAEARAATHALGLVLVLGVSFWLAVLGVLLW